MKLNLCCGKDHRRGYLNIDNDKDSISDIIYDLDKGIPVKTGVVNEIIINHGLEHLQNPYNVLQEMIRVSKDGGIIKIRTPYYHCQGAFQDITHKHFFAITTFKQYIPQKFPEIKNTKITIIPSKPFKIIPTKILIPLSLLIGEIIKEIQTEYTIQKKHKKPL